MLHTTRKLLREANACKGRYEVFREATKDAYKDNDPIPLYVALDSNGGDDALWAMRAVLPGEEAERDKLARLFACDCAERVLPIYETSYPNNPRPRHAIETARSLAKGEATVVQLAAARDAAWAAAWDAAIDAAIDAALGAERKWQAQRLRDMLTEEHAHA